MAKCHALKTKILSKLRKTKKSTECVDHKPRTKSVNQKNSNQESLLSKLDITVTTDSNKKQQAKIKESAQKIATQITQPNQPHSRDFNYLPQNKKSAITEKTTLPHYTNIGHTNSYQHHLICRVLI